MSYPWSTQQWLDTAHPDYAVFFHCPANELQGFALYHVSEIEKLAHLLKIAVSPSLRGTGAAVMFWEKQVATLRARKLERIYLEVASHNGPARGFYQKLGFKMLREVKSFYSDGQSAVTMELAI
jgi:ribosomal-protein-alanine N-acetyltransferase